MRERRLFALLLALAVIVAPLAAQAAAETDAPEAMRTFTDDLGRTVEIPVVVDELAPSGSMAQVILLTFDASKLVGLTTEMTGEEAAFHPNLPEDLPVLGTFYGKKANLNKEALIVADPDVVVDIGEIKGSTEEMISDLDVLQEQIGIPVVFIENYLSDSAHTYERIGELVGDPERAAELAEYAAQAVAFAEETNGKFGGEVTFYYASSVDGLGGLAKGNFHCEVPETLGGVNVVDGAFASGSNSVTLEQIFLWDPDLIILGDPEAYADVTAPGSAWSSLTAVENGNVVLVPEIVNNFIDSPPSVNRLVGIWWMADALYGDAAGVDVRAEVERFHELFYGYEVTDADLAPYGI